LVAVVEHPVKDSSRSHPKSRQHRNLDLDGEEGRVQRQRHDQAKIRLGQRLPLRFVIASM
jgi:hypothetical protein